MRPRSVLVLVVGTLLVTSGFRSSVPPIGPGGKIGTMTLVRGTEPKADDELWRFCAPNLPKAGTYHRTCSVPHIERLFIGYGDWERTRKALDAAWKQLKWDLWFDGRRVDLPRFGTSERTLYFYPPAGGKTVILRVWSVTMVRITTGKHVVRYRSQSRSLGTTDASWKFTVG